MSMKAATIPQPLARSRRLAATESQPSFRAIARPLIDIVVPVLNEEKILQKSITTLDEYMAKHLPYRYQITIADNGSQDKTLEIAKNLAEKHQSVRVVSLAERGRVQALKQVWQNSPADILTYMDVNLFTSQNQTGQNSQAPSTQNNNSAMQNNQAAPSGSAATNHQHRAADQLIGGE